MASREARRRVGLMANQIARRLRKTMTRQKVKLWVHLRSWRSRGYHFRRQSPRDGFIVDFVCVRHRLIIEVDGGQHNFDGRAKRDHVRDRHFERNGFKVLRFWNNEVDQNLEGVLTVVDEALQRGVEATSVAGGGAMRVGAACSIPPPQAQGEGGSERAERSEETGGVGLREKKEPHPAGLRPTTLPLRGRDGTRGEATAAC